jgi:hypothetical protein
MRESVWLLSKPKSDPPTFRAQAQSVKFTSNVLETVAFFCGLEILCFEVKVVVTSKTLVCKYT